MQPLFAIVPGATSLAVAGISAARPLIRPAIFERWLTLPQVIPLAPLPLL